MEFKSIEEIKDYYFPNRAEKEKVANMTPKEYGDYLAKKSLEEIKKYLNKA